MSKEFWRDSEEDLQKCFYAQVLPCARCSLICPPCHVCWTLANLTRRPSKSGSPVGLALACWARCPEIKKQSKAKNKSQSEARWNTNELQSWKFISSTSPWWWNKFQRFVQLVGTFACSITLTPKWKMEIYITKLVNVTRHSDYLNPLPCFEFCLSSQVSSRRKGRSFEF